MRLLDALLAPLWRGGERLREAQRQLAIATARVEKLEIHHRKLQDRASTLEKKLEDAYAATGVRKTKGDRQRRRILSSRVLRDLLPGRREQVMARAGAIDAAAREARLLEMSDAYRDALAAGTPGAESAVHIRLDSLEWWVPISAADRGWGQRNAATETLPYRGLIHAREVCTGGIMLDLGAHDGGTAIPRVILGDVDACYCAEPDPTNYACLVANIVANGLRGFVLPDRIALGGREGSARLVRHKSARGHHVVTGQAGGEDTDRPQDVEVRVRTLDGWVSDLGIDPRAISFVKSDIQGYELQMLTAAPRLLERRHIAWQLEFAPRLLIAAGGSPRDFYALLQRYFTHFIDLSSEAPGERVRPIAEVADALSYVEQQKAPHTDVIVYSATR